MDKENLNNHPKQRDRKGHSLSGASNLQIKKKQFIPQENHEKGKTTNRRVISLCLSLPLALFHLLSPLVSFFFLSQMAELPGTPGKFSASLREWF